MQWCIFEVCAKNNLGGDVILAQNEMAYSWLLILIELRILILALPVDSVRTLPVALYAFSVTVSRCEFVC